jgi:hypothetical protein
MIAALPEFVILYRLQVLAAVFKVLKHPLPSAFCIINDLIHDLAGCELFKVTDDIFKQFLAS